MAIVEKLHEFSSFALFGLIWVVQLVHYPSFRFINRKLAKEYQEFHMQWITVIVAPLMICELATVTWLLSQSLTSEYLWTLFGATALIWLNTALLNVPTHNKLLVTYTDKNLRELVKRNWPRTILWTLKTLLLILYPLI